MQAGRRSASLRYTCANTTIKIPENISRSYANSRLIISVNRSLSSCSVIQEPFSHTPELLREIFRFFCLSSSLKQSGFDDRTKTVKSEKEKPVQVSGVNLCLRCWMELNTTSRFLPENALLVIIAFKSSFLKDLNRLANYRLTIFYRSRVRDESPPNIRSTSLSAGRTCRWAGDSRG